MTVIWVLPGGHPVGGESMRPCATRETREEIGVEVELGRYLFAYEIVVRTSASRRVEPIFGVTARRGAGRQRLEIDRHLKFVALDDLLALNLRPPLGGCLRGLRDHQVTRAADLGNIWRRAKPT
jgi:ADP-ribose pyrophosphatase YjhB (NUDIX family)